MRQRLRSLLLRWLGRLLRQPHASAATRRILVVKPDHLGDVLLLTPALRVLRQQQPTAEIVVMIGPWSQAALAGNPDVDATLLCPFPGFTRAAKPEPLQPYLVLLRYAWLLRAGHFDTAIVARDDHWWGALLLAIAGIPRRIGFDLPETRPFLTTALPHSFAEHVTAQSLALVAAVTGRTPERRPALRAPFTPADAAWADAWLARHVLDTRPLVALHPGSGGAAKLWIEERWEAVLASLQQLGAGVILTGGAAEADLVETIAGALPELPATLIGAATLGQLAAIFARCDLVLGVDSGPLHLAAATGVPTLALFGPGDHQRFGPWGQPHRNQVLRSGLWCSPCGVLDHCPRGTAPSECMALIGVTQVVEAAAPMIIEATRRSQRTRTDHHERSAEEPRADAPGR